MLNHGIFGDDSETMASVLTAIAGIALLLNIARFYRFICARSESSPFRISVRRAPLIVRRAERIAGTGCRIWVTLIAALIGASLAAGGLYGIFRCVAAHLNSN